MRLCVCVCVYVCASAYRCVYVWRQVTSIRQYNWVQYRTYLRHHIDMRNMTMRKCKLFSEFFFFIVRVGVCCFLMLFLPQLWNKFKCQIAVWVRLYQYLLWDTISMTHYDTDYINDSPWHRHDQWLTLSGLTQNCHDTVLLFHSEWQGEYRCPTKCVRQLCAGYCQNQSIYI